MTGYKDPNLTREQRIIMDQFFDRRRYARAAETVIVNGYIPAMATKGYITSEQEVALAHADLVRLGTWSAETLHKEATRMSDDVYNRGMLWGGPDKGWRWTQRARDEQLASERALSMLLGWFKRIRNAFHRMSSGGRYGPKTVLERDAYAEMHSLICQLIDIAGDLKEKARARKAALFGEVTYAEALAGTFVQGMSQAECQVYARQTKQEYQP